MPQQLKDKVAMVTDASRGVGLATAKLLHEQGANVIMTDVNSTGGELAQQVVIKKEQRVVIERLERVVIKKQQQIKIERQDCLTPD